MLRYIIPFTIFAGFATAETAMTGAEFERYTAGKTVTFGTVGDTPYGIEQYKSGRRVVWSFRDGTCSDGHWYEAEGNICFLYDFDPDPKCWQFFETPNGLRAQFMKRPETSVLYEARDSTAPLICPGPDRGV